MVERVRAVKTGFGGAVRVMDGATVTLRDSEFQAEDGAGITVSGPAAFAGVTARIDHVTAVARGAGNALYLQSSAGRPVTATVSGSILRAATNDVRVDQSGADARLSLGTTFARTPVATVGTPIIVDQGTNSAATPVFADLAGGDLHQAPTSPTVDPADADVAATSGARDIDRDPRLLGDAIDAGADEFRPAPAVTTAPAVAVGSATATVRGTVDTRGLAGTWAVEYGPTTACGSTTPARPLAAGRETVDVAAALEGLPVSATLHYRVVATTPGGSTNGPDASLTTTAIPTVLVPGPTTTLPGTTTPGGTTTVPAASPKVTGLRVRGTTLTYTASAAGQLRIVVKRGKRTVQTIVRTVRKGKGTIRLGRLGKGRYRVSVMATTRPGKATSLGFRRR